MNKVIDNIMYVKDIPLYYKDICYSKLRYYLQPYVNTTYTISKITENIYLSDMPTATNKFPIKFFAHTFPNFILLM